MLTSMYDSAKEWCASNPKLVTAICVWVISAILVLMFAPRYVLREEQDDMGFVEIKYCWSKVAVVATAITGVWYLTPHALAWWRKA